ncbi:unnamed protein product [Acanthoscelides obtectus]|uniref:MADF domain-containing protein n=1 Tax=Acanthoscelides obtectus TaxID=200917 RepID=A0A9P0PJD1_ACAOB|nr:unnamed protein product [Acanthoscelides obtectus]CAK1669095.1 hypothetical protein AOBTE_LOCUS26796 [Acanthoscelides obtectus]
MEHLDVELFIDAIEKRPSLWDSSSGDYKNRQLKRDDWKEVCEIVIQKFGEKDEKERQEIGKHFMLITLIHTLTILFKSYVGVLPWHSPCWTAKVVSESISVFVSRLTSTSFWFCSIIIMQPCYCQSILKSDAIPHTNKIV